jgi:hypothetical protein
VHHVESKALPNNSCEAEVHGDGRDELQTAPVGHDRRQSVEGPAGNVATASASGAPRETGLARQTWLEGLPQRRGGLWEPSKQLSRGGIVSVPSAANPFASLASVRVFSAFTLFNIGDSPPFGGSSKQPRTTQNAHID